MVRGEGTFRSNATHAASPSPAAEWSGVQPEIPDSCLAFGSFPVASRSFRAAASPDRAAFRMAIPLWRQECGEEGK